jgi:hypothetical protein
MGKMTSIEGHPNRKEVWRRNIRSCAFIPGGGRHHVVRKIRKKSHCLIKRKIFLWEKSDILTINGEQTPFPSSGNIIITH